MEREVFSPQPAYFYRPARHRFERGCVRRAIDRFETDWRRSGEESTYIGHLVRDARECIDYQDNLSVGYQNRGGSLLSRTVREACILTWGGAKKDVEYFEPTVAATIAGICEHQRRWFAYSLQEFARSFMRGVCEWEIDPWMSSAESRGTLERIFMKDESLIEDTDLTFDRMMACMEEMGIRVPNVPHSEGSEANVISAERLIDEVKRLKSSTCFIGCSACGIIEHDEELKGELQRDWHTLSALSKIWYGFTYTPLRNATQELLRRCADRNGDDSEMYASESGRSFLCRMEALQDDGIRIEGWPERAYANTDPVCDSCSS